MKMILDLFAGGHSVTVVADAGMTTASASSTTDVAKNTEVTLTLTPDTGYEVKSVEVLAGGVTYNPSTKKFTMGEADVVIVVKSRALTSFLVTEEIMLAVNDTRVQLHKNAKVVLTPNGVPKEVIAEGGATTVTMSAAVQSAIDQGILVPI